MVLRAGAVELRLFDNTLEDKVVMAIPILMDILKKIPKIFNPSSQGVPIMMETLFAADTAPSLARLTALDVGGCGMSCSGISELLGTISEQHDGMRYSSTSVSQQHIFILFSDFCYSVFSYLGLLRWEAMTLARK